VQVAALTAVAPGAAAAPPADAALVVFADMPQMLGAKDLTDYSTKRGSAIFDKGCKALNKWLCHDSHQTIIFVKALHHHATVISWKQGSRQITTFSNGAGRPVNMIKSHGQSDHPQN
jgi:hypothetical protein